jgi:hypothetical protein
VSANQRKSGERREGERVALDFDKSAEKNVVFVDDGVGVGDGKNRHEKVRR